MSLRNRRSSDRQTARVGKSKSVTRGSCLSCRQRGVNDRRMCEQVGRSYERQLPGSFNMRHEIDMRTALIVALSVLLISGIAIAQSDGPYNITQSVIANGGGRSSDAQYSITGTAGQHAAG